MSALKTCTKCGIEKSLDGFQQDSKTKDGLNSSCKACKKVSIALQKEKKITNGTWEAARVKRNERCAKRALTTPIKCKAQSMVRQQLTSGKMVKQPCEVCGEARVHGHHDDYSKPLEVRWLCSQHHVEWHWANGPGANGDELATDFPKKIDIEKKLSWKMGDLSPFERHALEALSGTTFGKGMRPSAVGYAIWEKCDPTDRKSNPSPQGLALLAGKFLHRLCKAKLATHYKGYMITEAGRAAIATTKAAK